MLHFTPTIPCRVYCMDSCTPNRMYETMHVVRQGSLGHWLTVAQITLKHRVGRLRDETPNRGRKVVSHPTRLSPLERTRITQVRGMVVPMNDDLCDICMSSGVNVSRTTPCGKTIGIECGCDRTIDTCGNPNCEECKCQNSTPSN